VTENVYKIDLIREPYTITETNSVGQFKTFQFDDIEVMFVLYLM